MRKLCVRQVGSFLLFLLLACVFGEQVRTQAQAQSLVRDVRAAIAQKDFPGAERLIATERQAHGVTPEVLEAHSWLGRGALAAERWDQADAYARETYTMAQAALKNRPVDQEPHLPIALGAALEVRAQVSAHHGARSDAVAMLQRELNIHRNTSMAKRIQKNINLLSMEGAPAPPLDLSESLAPRPLSLTDVKGKVVVLFFWAHWCPDCKAQAPVLKELGERFVSQGLTVIAPTQRFGYVAGGREAGAEEENRYIEQIRKQYYDFLQPNAVALSAANHQRYGVSSTPTVVITDRQGIVRTYHPGNMTKAELETVISRLLAEPATRGQ